MEVRAVAKYVKVQPRKVRIVADEIRGKTAVQAAALLRYHPSKSAYQLRKVLISAVANAIENNGLDPEQLKVSIITVDEGPRQKRIQARAMGRANRILKKTSHITVVVEDFDPEAAVKPHGTKAKPRPTFAAPTKGKKGASAKKAKEESPVTPGETTDTDIEEVVAAAPEEATPVTASDAPEEGGAAQSAVTAEPTATVEGEATETEAPASEEKA
ncbi:MAG: 50S ribosomal protein L22 [Fimbriimonas sp.]